MPIERGLRPYNFVLVGIVLLSLLFLGGCGANPTPTPAPFPTALPTATPGLTQVVNDALFTISLDDRLLATEQLGVSTSDDQTVIFSEVRWQGPTPRVERRTLLISSSYSPLRYDLEQSVEGVRSVWAAERRTAALDILNNNQQWAGPVLYEGVSPAPAAMIEGLPSALPYVMLGLRYAQSPEEMADLQVVDVTEDRPVSRPMALRLNPDRTGAVIGTSALEITIDGGLNPEATIWLRPSSRALYGVEIPNARFGFWGERLLAGKVVSGTLRIQRVSKLPQTAESTPIDDGGSALGFASDDHTQLEGSLYLPQGQGPFPCLIAHSLDGPAPRWREAAALTRHGWAVYTYDKRGVGESKGDYARGNLVAMAEDAVAAATAVAQRPDIDPQRIVFLGLSEGAQVGALALSQTSDYAGAALGAGLSDVALFPDLVDQRIQNALAPAYGWSPENIQDYRQQSVLQWQDWLFARETEVALVGRRVSLKGLTVLADVDLVAAMGQVQAPVLVLLGEQDQWTPMQGTVALVEQLQQGSQSQITLETFPELGAELTGREAGQPLAPEVEAALVAWLTGL